MSSFRSFVYVSMQIIRNGQQVAFFPLLSSCDRRIQWRERSYKNHSKGNFSPTDSPNRMRPTVRTKCVKLNRNQVLTTTRILCPRFLESYHEFPEKNSLRHCLLALLVQLAESLLNERWNRLKALSSGKTTSMDTGNWVWSAYLVRWILP